MAALGDVLDADIGWHQPGANRFSGEHEEQGAVFQMLGSMMSTPDTAHAQPTHRAAAPAAPADTAPPGPQPVPAPPRSATRN